MRGFAADEGAAVGAAGLGEALDDGFDGGVVEFAGGEVVEKEKRGRSLDRDVVNTMIYKVLSDGVMNIELEGYFELGADAVGGGDEDGIREALEIEGEQSAEAAYLTQNMLVEGFAGKHLDALLGAFGGRDIDAGIGIADGFFA